MLEATPAVQMEPSHRGIALPASPIRRLAPIAEAVRARGTRVIHLNIGQPDLAPPDSVPSGLAAASEEFLAYAPTRGHRDVLEAWNTYYRHHGIETETGDILVTAGASEALSLALLATCDAGDEVLVPEPFYAPYKGLMAMTQVNIVPVPLGEGFSPPSVEDFRQRITPKTQAILLCSPNNPTGTVFSRQDLADIGALAVEAGLFILSDETYREIVFDGPPAPSALAIPGLEDHVVVIDSLSKRFNVCGLRIGSLVSKNPSVMAVALQIAELRLAVPVVDQRALIDALTAPLPYIKGVVAAYRARREAAVEALNAIPGVQAFRPDGTFYVIARLPVDDAESFCAWMLGEFTLNGETVMVTPMNDFYATPEKGQDEVRIALVLDSDTLVHAISILGTALADYPGRR